MSAVNASAPHSLILEFGCWQTCGTHHIDTHMQTHAHDDDRCDAEAEQDSVSQQRSQWVGVKQVGEIKTTVHSVIKRLGSPL